jgi:hypothetical protein
MFEDTLPYQESGSVVTEVVRVPTGIPGLRIPADSTDIPFSKTSALVLSPSSLLSNGYRCSFLGTKQPTRKVHHSPLSIVEVKSEWSYTPTPLIFLRGSNRDIILDKTIATSTKVCMSISFNH